MSQLGWIDFSLSHRNKVMQVLDLFKEQGVIDEMGLGSIRDSLSDLLFPGLSTIQTRAKYFVLIPWIFQDLERRGKFDRFYSDLEESEINFIKVLRKNSPPLMGVIGATLDNANPKRKPSSIYWNGLRAYGILNFSGSLGDYIQYLKYYSKNQKTLKREIAESSGNVPGDDIDAHHLSQKHLWCQLPKPPAGWRENISIDLTEEEAQFIKERIILSNPNSLWAYTLKHIPNRAISFSEVADFLAVDELPNELKILAQTAADFNFIMQGALIRYNLLIQLSRENGCADKLQPVWDNYWLELQNFDWSRWSTERLWKYCQFNQYLTPTKRFVENWIGIVQSSTFKEANADKIIQSRELSLKGIRRARLNDKSIAQKQQTITGISVSENENVSFFNYRWHIARSLLREIQNTLENNVAAS